MKRTKTMWRCLMVICLSLMLTTSLALGGKGGAGFGGGRGGLSGAGRVGASPFSAPRPPSGVGSGLGGGLLKAPTPGPSGLGGAPAAAIPRPAPAGLPAGRINVDTGAARAMQREQSQGAFQAANPAPRAPAAYVRDSVSSLPPGTYATRQARSSFVYTTYYNRPVPVYATGYSDPFSNVFFWMWLMDRDHRDERDQWIYNHRDQIDQARYEKLRMEDADLDNRLAALEARGAQKDPTYTPKGIDPDLVYDDDSVKKAYEETHEEPSHFPWGATFLVFILCGLVYGVFFFRFRNGREMA